MARPLELTPAAMRRLGYRAVDAVVRHRVGLERGSTGRIGTRRALRRLLDEPPPRAGRPPGSVLRRVERQVMRHTLACHHPRFFGFIPSGATYPGALGDLLASGFNVFAGTWLEASGPAQVELTVVDWFRRWIGMPRRAGGLMLSGGSAANLTALVTARETALGTLARGARARAVVYFSDQAHSSLERAARILDIPPQRLRRVPTDRRFRMQPQALLSLMKLDRRRGLRPFFLAANAGSTNTGSIDPLPELSRLCRRERVWLHVDAAYGGFASLSRRGRALLRGLGSADSVTLDPHKWLFAPFDVGCLLVRDRALLRRTFAIHPEYMQDIRAEDEEVNFYEYGPQLTRSFRALKVWMIVQIYGTRRLAATVEGALTLARRAEAWLRRSPRFEILSPATLGIVCFRYRPDSRGTRGGAAGDGGANDGAALDRLNDTITRSVQARRNAFFSSTILRGRHSLRLCILNPRTRWSDVRATLEEIRDAGERLSRLGTNRGQPPKRRRALAPVASST
jgi:glutamate/tyrosine decarboxylase-like PLP-dependent enzyme